MSSKEVVSVVCRTVPDEAEDRLCLLLAINASDRPPPPQYRFDTSKYNVPVSKSYHFYPIIFV